MPFYFSQIAKRAVPFLFLAACWAQTSDPPRITSSTFITVAQATSVSIPLNANGGTPPYIYSLQSGTLPTGLFLTQSGVIIGAVGVFGDYFANIRVTDTVGQSSTASFQFRVVQPLTIITGSLANARTGSPYSQTLTGSGGFTVLFSSYTWSLVSGALPLGLVLNSSGEIAGTPQPPPGIYTFTVRMADSGNNSVLRAFTISVDGPSISTVFFPNAKIGTFYGQGALAVGGEAPYTWILKGGFLPPGLQFNSGGYISGTPTALGNFPIELRVVDNRGSYFDRTFNLIVEVTSTSLLIVTDALAEATVGGAFRQQLVTSGGRDPMQFALLAGTLPPGLNISTAGVIAGTPTAEGTYNFTIQVIDANGQPATRTYTLTVKNVLSLSRITLPATAVGERYSQQLIAQGGTLPLIWSPFGGNLPAGLTLNAATGVLSGVASEVGIFTFAVRVQDSRSQSAIANYTIQVLAPSPLFSVNGLLNGASFRSTAIAPGEIVNLYGINFGPAQLAKAQFSNNVAITQLSETRVLFDGIPAPLLFAAQNQVALIVPYEVVGKISTNVVVEYRGVPSPPIAFAVSATAPGVFTSDSSGKGQAAALNEDGSLNSTVNPAKPGSIVVLYATGEGQTGPFGVSGKLAIDYQPKPLLPVTVQINGQPCEVLYAGAAPNLIAGLMQVNVRVPQGVTAIGSLPVAIAVGGLGSQDQVTIAVAP